jgi:hypothetical protein
MFLSKLYHQLSLKHTAFALALCLAAGGQCSLQQIHLMHSTASPPAPPITTLLPGFSYLAKVDCTGCSLLSASAGREDTRRTNALVVSIAPLRLLCALTEDISSVAQFHYRHRRELSASSQWASLRPAVLRAPRPDVDGGLVVLLGTAIHCVPGPRQRQRRRSPYISTVQPVKARRHSILRTGVRTYVYRLCA